MLGWFTGPSRPPDAQGLRGGMFPVSCCLVRAYFNLDDSPSKIDEGPETPAPIFAVRAFKSALFGTPRIDQDALATPTTTPADNKGGKKERSGRITKSPKVKQTAEEEPVIKPRTVSLMSPGKGILLTPGTGAARRKNVSFGGLAFNEKVGKEESHQADPKLLPNVDNPSTIEAVPQRRQTNLTKALYKARIGTIKDDKSADLKEPDEKETSVRSEVEPKAQDEDKEDIVADSADVTVDLNHPFSRSGQHWKAEYERYFKNSDREMKKIIKYGQSVKSFAAKKDSEASYLGEKLDQELSKVAGMEAKVSALAAQLAAARVQGSEESDQGKLVEELSKQTALAVRYQQKADKYRAALLKSNPVIVGVDGVKPATPIGSQNIILPEFSGPTEGSSLQAELEKYREVAKRAEEKASRLETENSMLTKALSKARTDAKGYEMSRLAMEESFKKKETGLTAAKEDYEARLKKLTTEHEKALHKLRLLKDSEDPIMNLTLEIPNDEMVVLANGALSPKPAMETDTSQRNKSLHRSRTQQSHVDIWSLAGHGDRSQDSPSRRKPADTQMFDSQGLDLGILKEIDRNVITGLEPQSPILLSSHTTPSDEVVAKNPLNLDPSPNEGFTPDSPLNEFDTQKAPLIFAPQVYKSSASRRTRDRRSTMASPRPSMVNFSTSPRKTAPTQPGGINITTEPSTSDNSFANNNDHLDVPSFVSTKSSRAAGSRRQPALPPDRLAAAKARLKEKSMERIAIGEGAEGKRWRKAKKNIKGQSTGVGEESEGGGNLLMV